MDDQLDAFAAGSTPPGPPDLPPGRLATPRTEGQTAPTLNFDRAALSEAFTGFGIRETPDRRSRPDVLEARARGHEAGDRAAAKAERLDPEWVAEAVAALGAFARSRFAPFIVEDARLAGATPPMPEGTDARAWGTVTRLAKRQGLIRPSGTYRAAATSNGSPKPEYVAVRSLP